MEGKKAKPKFCWKKSPTMSNERATKGKDEEHGEETASEPTSSKTEPTVKYSPLTTRAQTPGTRGAQAAAAGASPPTLQSDLHQKTAQRRDDPTDDDISDGWSDAPDNTSLGNDQVTPNLMISTLQKQVRREPVIPRTPSDWKLPDDYPRISLFDEVMEGIEGCQRIMDSFWDEFYAKSSPHTSPIVSFYSMKSTTGLPKTSSRASGQQKCTVS